jgi:hypothetical protein
MRRRVSQGIFKKGKGISIMSDLYQGNGKLIVGIAAIRDFRGNIF